MLGSAGLVSTSLGLEQQQQSKEVLQGQALQPVGKQQQQHPTNSNGTSSTNALGQ